MKGGGQKDGGEGRSSRVGVVEWVRKQQGCGSGAALTEAALTADRGSEMKARM